MWAEKVNLEVIIIPMAGSIMGMVDIAYKER